MSDDNPDEGGFILSPSGSILKKSSASPVSEDNVIQPFQLESSGFRGRIVKLGGVLDDVLTPHAYPDAVAHLVAENLTLSLLLSSMLKYDGIFSLQAQGDGPVRMLASDVTSAGAVRACASFDTERLEKTGAVLGELDSPETSNNHLAQYLGRGYIAFTVDPESPDMERYQGIVDLKGSSLVDCVQHYFSQSEQIGTGIKMAVGLRDGKWRAAGIMLQKMPEEGGYHAAGRSNLDEDDWRRSMILMDSCTDDEFLSAGLSPNEVLFRLFHEEGVRVFPPRPVHKECRCSQERVENILKMMSDDDRDYMKVDGKISMHCEFCGTDYVFGDKDLKKLFPDGGKASSSRKELVDAED
ncbi:MAG: Hsp33 family molecular chaperone HslO [Alphaproteobacteria bacterium]|nr:Hsp33 family molecular chaperone HslO [Alphaproteobacteria bacterium]